MRSYVSTGSSRVREDEKAVLSAYVSKVLKSSYAAEGEADAGESDKKLDRLSNLIVEKAVELASNAQWRDENDYSCDLIDESSDQEKRSQEVPLQTLVGNFNLNTSAAARHCIFVLISVVGKKVVTEGVGSVIPKSPDDLLSYISDIVCNSIVINEYTKAVVSLTDEEVVVARAGAFLTTGNSLGIGLGMDSVNSFTFDQLVHAVRNGYWRTKEVRGDGEKLAKLVRLSIDSISAAVGSADDYTLASAAESLLSGDSAQENISIIFNKLIAKKIFRYTDNKRSFYEMLSMNSKSISPSTLFLEGDKSDGV